MAFDLFLVWYLVLGFLMGNGVPHFVFGSAGRMFRSPFDPKSSPRTNVAWGLSNFVAATVIALGLAALGLYDSYALPVMVLGFWLAVMMFGTSISRFLAE